jgi:hypothetical protein
MEKFVVERSDLDVTSITTGKRAMGRKTPRIPDARLDVVTEKTARLGTAGP